ncbi:MAG: hypothetical protein J6H31_08155 [Butyrivibrio sp.]|nr:hypothetical protein [Butyrivibrio sp.]
MTQKTVRFYDDVPADINALKILDDYKKYGFHNAREMIIAAINKYVQGSDTCSLTLEEKDINLLADKIANRIGITTKSEDIGRKEKNKNENNINNDNNYENYQKALSFMDTL